MDRVKRWLAARTFNHQQFSQAALLLRQKEQLGLCLSLCLPTLNEAATIGNIVRCLKTALVDQLPLLDEILVIDSGSTDGTPELAQAAGAIPVLAADLLPQCGPGGGKGDNLWKALYRAGGDILVVLDADITNIHPGFVTGLVGPLLLQPEIGYVKACYERSSGMQQARAANLAGGRVTEILVRPFLAHHFPELAGFIQPLAGEFAARRAVLETLAYPMGYGVEAAHLLDLYRGHGLEIFAQTDLGTRCHRHRATPELGQMACAILQVLERRLAPRSLDGHGVATAVALSQFVRGEDGWQQQLHRIFEPERPPMLEVDAYHHQRRSMAAAPKPELEC